MVIKKISIIVVFILLVTSCAANKSVLSDIPEILIPEDWGKKLEQKDAV